MSKISRAWLISFVSCSLWVTTALAEATVVVELRTAQGLSADGTVELSKGEARHSCTTEKGRCEIKGVAGGLYTVEVKLPNKASPKPRTAMIPPSGEVKLIVNAD